MTVTQSVDEIYPERWLKANDIPDDGDLILTIMDVNVEALGENKDAKLILVFRESIKHLALNKTNAGTITNLYGNNPNDWIGKRVALFATEVQYAGKMTLAIRVRLRPPAQPQPEQQTEQQPEPAREPQQILEELGY